jgi:hypothetical protein
MQPTTTTNRKTNTYALKYKCYSPKWSGKHLQTKHPQKKNNQLKRANISQLVQKNIPKTLELDLLEIINQQQEFNSLQVLKNCLDFLTEKKPKILLKLKLKKQDSIIDTLSKTFKIILTNNIKIKIIDNEISFVENANLDLVFGSFLYVDYIDQIKEPMLKKAYANLILKFKNHFEHHLNLKTPIEKQESYQDGIDPFVEFYQDDEENNSQDIFEQTNKTITHFQNQLETYKDDDWFNLLKKFKPTNDTDNHTKQILLQSHNIYSEMVYNFPNIHDDSEDCTLHFQELFRIFLVGETLEFEKFIIDKINDRANNYDISQPQIITSYNGKNKVLETSKEQMQDLTNLVKYIEELNNHLRTL